MASKPRDTAQFIFHLTYPEKKRIKQIVRSLDQQRAHDAYVGRASEARVAYWASKALRYLATHERTSRSDLRAHLRVNYTLYRNHLTPDQKEAIDDKIMEVYNEVKRTALTGRS